MTCPLKLAVCAHTGRETTNVAIRKTNNFILNFWIGCNRRGCKPGEYWIQLDDDPVWAVGYSWACFSRSGAAAPTAPDSHEIEQPGPRIGHPRRAPRSWPSKTALSSEKTVEWKLPMLTND
jgi:hypothetical protein